MMPIPKYSIQYYRGLNYSSHYDKRQMALSYSQTLQASAARMILESDLPAPRLNTFGCDCYTGEQMRLQVQLAAAFHNAFPAYLSNIWYWSQEGWDDFQKQWQELPEVINKVVDKKQVIHNLGGFYEYLPLEA